MANRLINLEGMRFGRLTVIERAANHIHPNGKTSPLWLARCDCGNEILAFPGNLKRGASTSCGCKKREPQPWRTRAYREHIESQLHTTEVVINGVRYAPVQDNA